jgi:tetratricopeptide (TPR) repeat protein
MRNKIDIVVVAMTAALAAGCGGSASIGGKGAKGAEGEGVVDATGKPVSDKVADKFKTALEQLGRRDAANDWNEASCNQVAESFRDASDDHSDKLYEALYNAGVAYQRCKKDAEAKKIFQEILGKNGKFHRARVQVALYDFAASGERDVEKAIGEMKRAIEDAQYKNEEALVQLAMLLMKRDGDTAELDPDGKKRCENDYDCAKLNLQRALAINDGYMAAYNQLAVCQLEIAKKKAGRVRGRGRVQAASALEKRADSQALELAALVVSQALRKDPKYAPVHNTAGLIAAELGHLSEAVEAFGNARKLDPKFFEANMNYAAVNMQFRGFGRAEEAYRAALQIRPKDYEAHLGLALAIRGQLTDPSDAKFDGRVGEVSKYLAAARQLAPDRAETYYNEAIFVEEFKARYAPEARAEGLLLEAKKLHGDFVSKAGDRPEYKEGVKRAKERIQDIDTKIDFAKKQKEAPPPPPPPAPAAAPAPDAKPDEGKDGKK